MTRIFILLIILCIAKTSHAWNDERTHPAVSEFTAEKFFGSAFLDESINGQLARKYVRQGSILEDTGSVTQFLAGKARSLNHFHNPARATPGEAGLTDIPSNMSPGMSTLLWAQDGDYQKTKPRGDWSWQKVRDYQYNVTALSKGDSSHAA